MKAPEKIYVREHAEGINQLWDYEKRQNTSMIVCHEYIRSDLVGQPVTDCHDLEQVKGPSRDQAGTKFVEEGLDEEMEKFFETMPVLEHENIFEDTFKNIARHFAEWGAEYLKR